MSVKPTAGPALPSRETPATRPSAADPSAADPSAADPSAAAAVSADLLAVLAVAPAVYVLLAADAPRFTMLAMSDARLAATMTTREATVGRPLFEVFADANPENAGREGIVSMRASLEEVVRTGRPQHLPVIRYDLRRPDGGWEVRYWRPANIPVPGPDGAVRYILHHAEDVTAEVVGREALARAERRAARILDRMADAHLVLDRDFRVVAVNPAAERLVGAPRDALLGRTHWELFPASAGTEVERHYRRVRDEGVEAHFAHHYVGGGHDAHLEIDAYPTEEGGVALFWRDVTARVGAREEAERALAEAEAANRAKGEFLAVMSHELRTPLNAIGGYAELIGLGLHGPVTPEQRQALERIQRSQRALLSVINEVLNFARVETGAVTYALATVPVAEAVGAAELLVAPQLRAKGLGYGWAGCEPQLAVRADPDKLQQILLNLLSNAIKFTDGHDGRPGRVEVSGCVDPTGQQVELRVRDTGIGIPPDKLAAVFEPFVQVETALTRTQQGTGLGLAISRDLARGMGGDLTAESTPGAGSTFTLTLPRDRMPDA